MITLLNTLHEIARIYLIQTHLLRQTVKQGVSPEDASYFLGRTYLSIVQDAERNSKDPTRFDELIKEQTPGGLNEQVSHNHKLS